MSEFLKFYVGKWFYYFSVWNLIDLRFFICKFLNSERNVGIKFISKEISWAKNMDKMHFVNN